MIKKTLDDLTRIVQKYLDIEHPAIVQEDADVSARLNKLYDQLMTEIEGLDSTIIRHRAFSAVDNELDLVMEIERVGMHSGFCLHIDQDDALIARWTEERFLVD